MLRAVSARGCDVPRACVCDERPLRRTSSTPTRLRRGCRLRRHRHRRRRLNHVRIITTHRHRHHYLIIAHHHHCHHRHRRECSARRGIVSGSSIHAERNPSGTRMRRCCALIDEKGVLVRRASVNMKLAASAGRATRRASTLYVLASVASTVRTFYVVPFSQPVRSSR